MARNDPPRHFPSKDSGAITEGYSVTDYTNNMFEDGHNRTETNKKVHDAPAYDQAAHTVSPDIENPFEKESNVISLDSRRAKKAGVPENGTNTPRDTFRSRDGTDASGLYDEDGGSIGGTEDELDSLEAGGTPVDKNPRMKG